MITTLAYVSVSRDRPDVGVIDVFVIHPGNGIIDLFKPDIIMGIELKLIVPITIMIIGIGILAQYLAELDHSIHSSTPSVNVDQFITIHTLHAPQPPKKIITK